MQPKYISIIMAATMLSACSTVSFAPPNVETRHTIYNKADCAISDKGSSAIEENIVGAGKLIENFRITYRCAGRLAANGRQIFEVPSFLATVAGLVGPTFGLRPDGVLAAGAGAGFMNSAKAYYDPKEKAKYIDAALDAVLCVSSASVNNDYYGAVESPQPEVQAKKAELNNRLADLRASRRQLVSNKRFLDQSRQSISRALTTLRTTAVEAEGEETVSSQDSRFLQMEIQRVDQLNQSNSFNIAELDQSIANAQSGLVRLATSDATEFTIQKSTGDGGTVQISVSKKYYKAVSDGLFKIDHILGEQLRDVGTVDSDTLFSELKELFKKEAEDEDKAKKAETDVENANAGIAAAMGVRANEQKRAEFKKNNAVAKLVDVSISLMQTRINTCVLKARIAES